MDPYWCLACARRPASKDLMDFALCRTCSSNLEIEKKQSSAPKPRQSQRNQRASRDDYECQDLLILRDPSKSSSACILGRADRLLNSHPTSYRYVTAKTAYFIQPCSTSASTPACKSASTSGSKSKKGGVLTKKPKSTSQSQSQAEPEYVFRRVTRQIRRKSSCSQDMSNDGSKTPKNPAKGPTTTARGLSRRRPATSDSSSESSDQNVPEKKQVHWGRNEYFGTDRRAAAAGRARTGILKRTGDEAMADASEARYDDGDYERAKARVRRAVDRGGGQLELE